MIVVLLVVSFIPYIQPAVAKYEGQTALHYQQQKIRYDYEILWEENWEDGGFWTRAGYSDIDENNNIYMSAYLQQEEKRVVRKYNTDGEVQWETEIDIDGIEYSEFIDVEPYVIGGYQQPLGNESFNVTDVFELESVNSSSRSYYLCVDQTTNEVVVLGNVIVDDDQGHQDEYIVIAKYDGEGNELWKKAYTFLLDTLNAGDNFALDSEGNIFTLCWSIAGASVLKLSPDGVPLWSRVMKHTILWWPLSLAIDGNDNVVTTSLYLNIFDPLNLTIYFATYSPNGLKLDDSYIPITVFSTFFFGSDLVIDMSTNDLYFGVQENVWKVNPSLELVWESWFPYPIENLAVDEQFLFVTGGFSIYLGDEPHYYSAMHSKISGIKILDIDLGPKFWAGGGFAELFGMNWMRCVTVDTDGNLIFSGGTGGLRLLKVRIVQIVG